MPYEPQRDEPCNELVNGHDMRLLALKFGPARWICDICKARSEEYDWFNDNPCRGQPDVVGGG